MSGGTIVSITPDRRGGTLATTTTGTDVVLVLEDATDFDEVGGWLVVADSAPLAYTGLDDDTETITLLGTAGAVYEAGLPVDLWDPTVHPAGAKVVEYKASVDLGNGVHPGVVIPHEKVPLAGIDSLIGASVTLTDEDEIDQILARDPVLDQSVIDTPFISLYQATAVTWPDSTTFDSLADWTVEAQEGIDYDPVSGEITFIQDGRYLMIVSVNWDGNSSGRRYIRLMSTILGVTLTLRKIPAAPPDSGDFTQQVMVGHPAVAGETMRVEAHQTSGAGLILHGDLAGTLTTFQAVRLQA